MRFRRWLYTVPLRVRSLFRRNSVELELDEELQYHLERQIQENIGKGMNAEEARYAALRAMGSVAQRKEECRDARNLSFIENFIQDLRYAARVLGRSPGFTAVAVTTLAVGIGSITTIFSVVNGVILRPLPYEDAGRLVAISEMRSGSATGKPYVAPPKGEDWGDRAEIRALLENMTWIEWRQFVAPERTDAPVVVGARVPPNYLSTIKTAPQLGRDFTAQDAAGAEPAAAIVSYPFWQRWLGADPGIIGKPLQFAEGSFTVVGVMPPAFRAPFLEDVQLWVAVPPDLGPGSVTIARMRPGITPDETESRINAVLKKLEQEYPASRANRSATVAPLIPVDRFHRSLLWLLFGSVGFILLIAVINVANLMLSRSLTRGREIAIRSALGAGRRRLVRQLMTESLVLAIPGGALGLAGAHIGVSLMTAGLPQSFPRLQEIYVDSTVLAFSLLATVLTSILFGVFPAFASRRPDLQEALRDASRALSEGRSSRRFRQMLVAMEIGLAAILLIGAALTGKSFWNLLDEPRGMETDKVVAARFAMRPRPEAARTAFYSDLLERIQRYPEVDSAGLTNHPPLVSSFLRPPFTIEGATRVDQQNAVVVGVTGGYFRTLRIGFTAGRPFADNEQGAVINQTMARKFWPNAEPVGSRIRPDPQSGPWLTVVGVVADEKLHPGSQAMPQIYRPCQVCTTLLVKSRDDSAGVYGLIRREIAAADNTALITNIQMVNEYASRLDVVIGYRFRMVLFLAFAGAGLLLAFAGIYGVTSYSTAQRTHEIGIRMALGATRRNVLQMIMRQSMVAALAGITAGVMGAAALTRLLESYLFEVRPTDTAVFILVPIFIGLVAMAANFIPSWRSTRIDPMISLKHE